MNWDKFLDALELWELDQLKAALLKRMAGASQFLNSEEMEWAITGNKIEAIRSLRNRHNIGLVEAKALVEKFLLER